MRETPVSAELSAEEARTLLDELRAAGDELRSRPVDDLVRVLGRVGDRFLDEADPLREEAEARLPDEAGLSPEMARVVIEGMARDWTGERLGALVRSEFRDPGVLDGFRPGPSGDRLRALGPRLILQVGAGSVPGVTATAMLRSLLVKSPVLVKPGRGDLALSLLVARGLAEADPLLSRSVAVVYWPGGKGGTLEEAALEGAELVVVHGGNETVRELRRRIPPTTSLVAYRHRVSVGLVARERLVGDGAREAARDAALAVATFDQRGCVSPHVIWIEEGGEVAPREWAELLADALGELEERLPSGPPDPETAARIQQLRGSAEMRAAAGTGDELHRGGGTSWSVLYETDPAFAPSCLGRTARVKPLGSLEEAPKLLRPFRGLLQTVALEADGERREVLAEGLAAAGATRITRLRDQPWPPAWWRHDGAGPLQLLVRWVALEG